MPSLISRVVEPWMTIVWDGRFVRALARVLQGAREGAVIAALLLAYLGCMFAYGVLSHLTIDVHSDVAELTVWARDLALGYKHPPLSAYVMALWLGMFPQTDWSMYLLGAVNMTAALAITWRLLRDHLDRDRALVGLAALMLVPLYLFPAMRYNANTAMAPFWAAATLFFLRALRRPSSINAVLAGVFTGLAFLGKYWSIYLIAGMAAVVLTTMPLAFWRTASPYLMALGAVATVAPHLWWVLFQQDAGSTHHAATIRVEASFADAFARSAFYIGGLFAYTLVPWIFYLVLWPGRRALLDTIWPKDADRRRALLLFVIPLALPALLNLALPHRLTPLWTFPNWALLPVALFGSAFFIVLPVAASRALIVAALPLAIGVLVSPVLAYQTLQKQDDAQSFYALMADEIVRIGGRPVDVVVGHAAEGVPFYMPGARALPVWPPAGALAGRPAALVCASVDAPCRAFAASLAGGGARSETVTLTRRWLGLSGPPASYLITVAPPAR